MWDERRGKNNQTVETRDGRARRVQSQLGRENGWRCVLIEQNSHVAEVLIQSPHVWTVAANKKQARCWDQKGFGRKAPWLLAQEASPAESRHVEMKNAMDSKVRRVA